MARALHRRRDLLGAARAGTRRTRSRPSSIIHDDRTLLELRVKQVRHPRAHARLPLARTVHQVGNVVVFEEGDGEIAVGSTLHGRRVPQREAAPLRRAGRAPAAPRERRLPHRAQARRPGELRIGELDGELDGIAILFLKKVFRDYDQKALDEQYEQRTWVPHADEIIKRYARGERSRCARMGEPRTERYGPSAIETLDIYGQRREGARLRPRRRMEAPVEAGEGVCRRNRRAAQARPTWRSTSRCCRASRCRRWRRRCAAASTGCGGTFRARSCCAATLPGATSPPAR